MLAGVNYVEITCQPIRAILFRFGRAIHNALHGSQAPSDKYEKDIFTCDDLQKILGLCKSSVRELMNGGDLPVISVGSRKIVLVIGLAAWMTKNILKTVLILTSIYDKIIKIRRFWRKIISCQEA